MDREPTSRTRRLGLWAFWISSRSTFQPDIPVGAFPLKIAISPDGTRAYVTNFSDHSVSIIDLSTNTVIDTVPVGLNPTGVASTS